MNKPSKKKDNFVEEIWQGVTVRYELTDQLHYSQTPFQTIQFVDTKQYGKMLLLDGIVQTTEKDEFIYHEMMTHVPMMMHPEPKNVLIIGGGDGGILREVLKHVSVEKVILAEIDKKVIDLSRQYLPEIHNGSFDDPRTQIVIVDGADYVKNSSVQFDVIIIDSPDPVGPAEVLFTGSFYQTISDCLNDNGIISRQCGSSFEETDEFVQAYGLAQQSFQFCHLYTFSVPTYIGGLFLSLICSNNIPTSYVDLQELIKRFESLNIKTRYYNPGIHFGSLQLPPYIQEQLE